MNPHPSLVPYEHLAEWLGYSKPGAVMRALRERGISYTTDRAGRPITTARAIDKAISAQADAQVDFL